MFKFKRKPIKLFIRDRIPILAFILLFGCLGSYLLINGFAASNPNVYIAQNVAGSGDGSSCLNAEPASFFNTSTNWGTNSNQIGPGTTVHLCGTITTALTAQGSGVSGNPITILWEGGAALSEPACSGTTGCFNTNNKIYLKLDGGTNGVIQNTQEGTGLTNPASSSIGVSALNCTGCTIQNLTIQNIYVHIYNASTSPDDEPGQTWDGIWISGNNLTINHDTFSNVAAGVVFENLGAADGNDTIENSTFKNMNGGWLVVPATGSGTNIGPLFFHNNTLDHWDTWDTTGAGFHHDGVHCFTSNNLGPSHFNGVYIYDNTFGPHLSTDTTTSNDVSGEAVFTQGNSPSPGGTQCADATSPFYIFNNVIMSNFQDPPGVLELGSGEPFVYNNTIIGPGGSGVGEGPGNQITGGGTSENNAITSENQLVNVNPVSGIATQQILQGGWDHNVYSNGSFNCNGSFISAGSGPGVPSAWQTCISGESHSLVTSNAMLNSDGTPQAGSPVVGAGTNLTSLCSGNLVALCSDINGNPRPATGAWDAGAYEYVPPPVNSGLPAISGTAQKAQALTVSNGSWTNNPTSYAYQWYDCDAVGNSCSAISGATASSYMPVGSDLGYTEYVAVTATNSSGSASANSALTPAIGMPPWNPGSTANIWINTTAGSCTRNSTPAAYNSSTACGSLQSAYAKASCGDTIEVEPGAYTSQNMSDVAALDACTNPVLIEGASTSNPSIISDLGANYSGKGPSNLVLEGLSQTATSCSGSFTGGSCDFIFLSGGHNIVLNQITGGAVGVYDNTHVLIENSSFGPCSNGYALPTGDCTSNTFIDGSWVNCSAGCPAMTADITFRNNIFNQFLDDPTGAHFECMFLNGAKDLMIDSNHFHICQLHSIFMQPASATMADTIIQNNWFDETENSITTAPYYDTAHNSANTNGNGVEFASNNSTEDANLTGITIRYNSFSPYTGIAWSSGTPAGPNYIYGNIAGTNTTACVAGATYGYNIYLAGQKTCAVTDTTVASLPYVDTAYGAENFHLTNGSVAQSFVTSNTAAYQLAYDFDGNTRPANGSRDAGSEQFIGSSGITGDLNGDGHVNIFDLSIFLSHWQQTGSGLAEDFNGDNIVNIFDLSILLSHYGT